MFRWLAQGLGNVSVNRKLGFGFGLVLFLTLMIAFTGWSGLGNVISRGDKLGFIASLNDLSKDLDLASIDYNTTRGEKGPQQVNDLLGKLETGLKTAREMIEQPDDVALIDKQLAAVAEYKSAFAQMTSATVSREDARSKLGASADNTVARVAEVEKALLQGGDITQFNSVVTLSKAIQQARYQVRGYTYSGKSEAQQPAIDAITDVLKLLARLPAQLPEEHADRLQQASDSMNIYRAAVSQFRDSQLDNGAALQRMSEQGQVLIDSSQKLTASQTAVRDHDTAQAKTVLIAAAALALLFGVIAAWLITRQIVGPLDETLKVAERVAAGDLTHNLTSERRDELGQLQRAMQRMTVGLRQLIGGIGEGVTQIASAAEQLSAVTEQTSAGVNSQKIETDQVATAMHEMTATVQEVARNAEEASEAAVAADQQAREGDKVVGEAIAQIERLAREVGNSTAAMGDLKRESDKIGSVLDVIKSVAQQTNLLALNAAIEAARAGEAGRGFAVVADEVRHLASNTQNSVEQIRTVIEALQQLSQEVVHSTQLSREQARDSVTQVEKTHVALQRITDAVEVIEHMNQQIASAALEQSAVVEDISHRVSDIRGISETLSSRMEEASQASHSLHAMANHQQQLVGHFRI
jgi:methyl-accepting chemotaxis protein